VNSCEFSVDTATSVASHEIAEIITDAAVSQSQGGLFFDAGQDPWVGEVGDTCNFSLFWQECGFTFVASWSNASAAAGLPPCVPWPSGVRYVNVSPDPAVPLSVSAGDSATITLTGWATAPGTPWRLRVLPDFYARQDFAPTASLEAPTINDGDRVRLTLGVPSGTPPGATATIRVGSVSAPGPLFEQRSNDWPIRIVAR
jgi:hypothetical protein